MIEINLVPDVKQELLKAQRTRGAVISIAIVSSIAAAGLVVLLLVYIFGVQLGRNALLDSQIKDKSSQLAEVEDLSQMVTIQNQLTGIDELNKQKTMLSRIFDALSAVVPATGNNVVNISQVDVDTTGKKTRIEGQTGTYDSVEVFKKTVEGAILELADRNADNEKSTVPLASDISVSDVSYGEDSNGNKVLRFVVEFTHAEELFKENFSLVNIKLSLNGNVTDSYLGIPKSLFTAPAKDIKEGN